jgi:adenosylmethionine-8-amino-7-oxononanoate aminotransferase
MSKLPHLAAILLVAVLATGCTIAGPRYTTNYAAVETLKLYEDEQLFANAARLEPVLRRELAAAAARLGVPTFVRAIGLLGALELEAPAAGWTQLGRELAARKLSLHADGKRGTCIFAPPCASPRTSSCVDYVAGDAAVAFGAAATGRPGSKVVGRSPGARCSPTG